MAFLENEPEIQETVEHLTKLLSNNEIIIRYKELEEKVHQNNYLKELTEEIKVAQKEAVQFGHYGKVIAEQTAITRANQLTKTFEQHPLVVAYRRQLLEANDLLHHLTGLIQDEINELLEEENDASKNEEHTNDGTISKH